MPRLLVGASSVSLTTSDAVVVAIHVVDGTLDLATPSPWWTRRQRRQALAAFAVLGATGAEGEVVTIPSEGLVRAPVIVGVGLGSLQLDSSGGDSERLRGVIGAAVRSQRGRVLVAVPAAHVCLPAIVDGSLLARGPSQPWRSRPPQRQVRVVAEPNAASQRLAREREGVCDAVALAQSWVDAPSNFLGPDEFRLAVMASAVGSPVSVHTVEGDDLLTLGLRAVHAVGRGSQRAPCLIRVDYDPPGSTYHLTLVGKGVVFDAGGISMKRTDGMWLMKADMAGAAAVVAATLAIAKLGLRVRVTAFAPTAENLPSGSALVPGTVVRTFSGRTVEVLDTDAEGRLLLADALALAAQECPDLLVDLATLTGSQRVALGPFTAGVMGDDAACSMVCDAAAVAGESMWRMPLDPRLRPRLDSGVADIANIGGAQGGMLIAGSFLRDFVPEGQLWAHIDMAGPAYHDDEPRGYLGRGATGFGVRTIVELAKVCSSS